MSRYGRGTMKIRLLTIIDDESDLVRCTIEHVSLRASPSYKALSYCWGDAKDTTRVVINGCESEVTVNLEGVLRQFGGESRGRIWIDALCINQRDLKERGEQVLRMGRIYSKAVEVIAWLGPEADDSNRAMDCVIQDITKLWEDEAIASVFHLGWRKIWETNSQLLAIPQSAKMAKWKEQNRDLLIAGRRLEDWALQGPDSLPLETWRKVYPSMLEGDLESGVAEDRLVRYMYQRLLRWRGWRRKILITSIGYVADGHPRARKGDVVCFLKNCWKGVVLRPRNDGFFQLIETAKVYGFHKGTELFLKLQKQVDEGRTETFHLV